MALDFAAQHAEALTAAETALVDFGTEDARRLFGVGWHLDERNRSTGDTFVWSRGEASELSFHLGWRRDLEVEIVGHPFEFPGVVGQTLAIELNGCSVGEEVSPPTARGSFLVSLPAEVQRIGVNTLTVRYGRVDSPASVIEGAGDERPLAYAWSEMRIVGIDDREVEAVPGTLTLPAGARVDHFVELAAGSELRIDSCETVGEASSLLEVSVLGENHPEQASTMRCSGGGLVISLGAREGLTRIRLATRPDDADGPPEGIRIHGPRVLSPQVTLPSSEPALQSVPHPETSDRPNVIIYLVDALRSDRLGAYGCSRGLTPRLDAMAKQGVVFTDMTAQSSWTKAAVASIFTGIWPRAHGVNGPDDRLPEHLPTIAERLQDAGYRTGAVVANAYVGRPFGFARGFDHFEYLEYGKGRSEAVGDRVESWLTTLPNDDSPFFLYVHAIDPHAPYAPPERFRERFAPDVEDSTVGRVEIVRGIVLGNVEPTPGLGRDLRALYDAEVAANDASFGRLLDLLEADGRLEDTLVIFTSDHGEAFGEHGSWTHGLDLYNEVLSVPLVVRLPGGADAERRVTAPVQHIDLLPTILKGCGIDGAATLPGTPLVAGNGVVSVGEDRTVLAYLDYWGKHGAAVIRDGWKLIDPLSAEFGEARELYRHDIDPTETHDLAVDSPVRSGWLASQLGAALRIRGSSVTTEVDPEIRKQLEALGYMQ